MARFSNLAFRTLAVVAVLAVSVTAAPQPSFALGPQFTLTSPSFSVSIDRGTGGMYQLSNPSDPLGTNYVSNPDLRPNFNVDDSRWTGDLLFSVKKGTAASVPANTSLSDDIRTVTSGAAGIQVAYSGAARNPAGIRDFSLVEKYALGGTSGNQLDWTFTVKNTSTQSLEFEDVGFPLLMNSWWDAGDQTAIYEQNVGRHSFVAKDGSYIYWQRPNGTGPFLVMIPQDGTSLEFKNKARYNEGPFAEVDPAWEGVVEYFVHSKNVSVQRANQAAQYLPATSIALTPGQEKTYGFTFRWANDYQDLRDVLFAAGVPDVVSMPGMVIPTDMNATLAVRAQGGITGIVGESGKNISITAQGVKNGYNIYQLGLPTLGTNNVTVQYGSGKSTLLQYYSVAPIEQLIASRASFLTTKQQAKVPGRGFDGAFLQWDMTTQRQITWDNYPGGGWKVWMAGGSDDLGLAPAEFLSEKNVLSPVQSELTSLDYYIQHFILGYLQNRTENGQRTWQVYRWYDGQEGTPADQGVWRAYNYIHIANTYLNMYRIKKNYPNVSTQFTADQYLQMSFKTIEAMYTKIPLPTPIGDAAHELGLMGESTYPQLLAALTAEGHGDMAQTLTGFISGKRDKLLAQAYPFASEASIDTTGFETNYTIAKMFGDRALADKVTLASLASRGLQPLWYFYGSDNRHMGESWWNLGYETQLGAWQQQDYLATYASTSSRDFDEWMRSTYGAYVGGWANINSGQISSAANNIGAASWQYQSEKGESGYSNIPNLNGWWAWSGEADLGFWGALRTATVNVVNDRILGTYAYGGTVSNANGAYTVAPKDGVRQRLVFYNLNKFGISLDRAKYTSATVAQDLSSLRVTIQGVAAGAVSPDITLTNLPAGLYNVDINSGSAVQQVNSTGGTVRIALAGLASGDVVTITKASGPAQLSGAARVSATYTAPWNRLTAINDGVVAGAGNSVDQAQLWGTYRDFGRPATDTVTFTLAQTARVGSVSATFWNDRAQGSGTGVALPASWAVEYQDAGGVWRPVSLKSGTSYAVNASGTVSRAEFDAVTAQAVRVVFRASSSPAGVFSAVAASEVAVFTP